MNNEKGERKVSFLSEENANLENSTESTDKLLN